MDPALRIATYDDLSSLPEDVHAELLDGQISVMPAPLPRHLKSQGVLRSVIGGPYDDDDGFGGPGGWWVFLDVEVRLGGDVVRPDLAGWRRARLADPDQRPLDVVPDWTCEVLSPSTAARDRVYKRRLYAKHGVRFYWLVDPDARTLEALELKDGVWADAGTFDETATARVRPFEGVEIAVGRLFLPRVREAGGA
jgi:Uma2 family endonuclease